MPIFKEIFEALEEANCLKVARIFIEAATIRIELSDTGRGVPQENIIQEPIV